MTTSASSPCVTIRRRGRPIVTGSDFDHPSANWIAAATTMMRAASTAPEILAPEHRLDEPWHREQKDRQRDEHQRRGNERVLPHTLEHALSSAVLPGPRLLGEEDEARGGAGRGEAGLRRLGDPEEADLCRSRDDSEHERNERGAQRYDTGAQARLQREGDDLAPVRPQGLGGSGREAPEGREPHRGDRDRRDRLSDDHRGERRGDSVRSPDRDRGEAQCHGERL